MRRYVLTVLIAGLPQSASADALTCASFKDRLIAAIHAGGDQVPLPTNFRVTAKDDAERLLVGFDGIPGIRGGLSCAPDDRFLRFSFKTAIDVRSEDATVLAIARTTALAEAAVCATEPRDAADCRADAFGMIDGAIQQMKQDHDRGDLHPRSPATLSLSPSTQARAVAAPGELLVEILSNLDP